MRGGFGSSGGVSVFNDLLGERAAGKPVNECYEITVDGIFGGNGDIIGDEFAVVIIANEGVSVVNRCFGKNGVLAFVYALSVRSKISKPALKPEADTPNER